MSSIINPFLKTQINSAWEKPADVQSINNQLSDLIIKTAEKNDQGSIVQMLIGAPGSGKTHLLTRIWKHSITTRSFLFVAVPPPGDISRINIHFLREFISSLLEQGEPDSLLPLDIFLTEILRTILIKTLPSEQQSIIERIKTSKTEDLYKLLTKGENRSVFINHSLNNFAKVFPNVDVQLNQALFALLDPFRKTYALKWFQGGELTEQEKRTLNIGTRIIDENTAISLTKSLILLSPLPIILTIDQMESTFYRFKQEGLIKLLDNSITLLQNNAKLFLLFVVQTQEWIDNIREILPRYIIDRISSIKTIKPLSLNESFDLARLRLNKFQMSIDTVFLNQKEFYPFSRDFISHTHSSAGGNPRKFLNILRDSFDVASQSNFNPSWEKDYETKESQKDNATESVSTEEFLTFFDNTLKTESSNLNISQIPLEKIRELEKGTFAQIFSETIAIAFLKEKSSEFVKINQVENEIIFDIILDIKDLSPQPIGIIIANQKNTLFFQGILEQVLSMANFSKIILLRSDSLKSIDVVPAVKSSLQNLNVEKKISFSYISSSLESQIVASKRIIDGSKDFNLKNFAMIPELVLWYVMYHFMNTENLLATIFSQEMIATVTERLQNRISHALLQISNSSSKSIRQWQSSINIDNIALVTNQGQGLEICVIFSYLLNNTLSWGLFRGTSLTSLKTFISIFIKQLHINWDPFSTFVFASNNNITGMMDTSMGDIVTQFGHGLHLTQREELTVPLESSVLGFIAFFRDLFSNVLPDKPMTPENLIKQANTKNIPLNVVSSLAQLLGHLFNVTFRNGQIYSLSSSSFESTQLITQSSVAEVFDQQKESQIQALHAQRDILELAEEKGEIQRVFDETVIDLTNRLQKFNLSIDSKDYEILSAILNYSKISPDKLTPLIKGLVQEYGDVTQKSSFRTISRQLSLEDIELQILSNYMPFKEKWTFIKSMPPLISKLGAQFFATGYRLNAFTLLDFHTIELNQNWHELISRSTKSFVRTNIEIQQLSDTYYAQKFESESKSLLLPIVNRYQTLILEESELLEKKYPTKSESRTNDYLDLSRHVAEWWMILEAYNRVVGFEFHLDNRQFMDEILLRFEKEFTGQKVNYISTDPFNFTILFENALELMSMDSDRLLQTIETRSSLSLIQSELYATLLSKQYRGSPEDITEEYSFWKSFYLVQINDTKFSNDYASEILEKIKILSEEFKSDPVSSGIILLQLALPSLVISQIKSEAKKLELLLLIYCHTLAYKEELQSDRITNILTHLIEMALLLPRAEQGIPTVTIPLQEIKSLFPFSAPLFKPIDKAKFKIQHTVNLVLGSKLTPDITEKFTVKGLINLGMEIKEDKIQKEGKKIIFRGLITEDLKAEAQVLLISSSTNRTTINLTLGVDSKYEDQIALLEHVLLSTVIINLVLEKQYLTLEDRAFVVTCSSCGYQINILKNKITLFIAECKNCNTMNIIAPNVYKIVKDVLK